MRPVGEIRQALRSAAPLAPQDGSPVEGASYLGLAEKLAHLGKLSMAAPSEVRLVKQTVKNMVQAGELRRVGEQAVPGLRKKLGLYAAAQGGWGARATARNDRGFGLQRAWLGAGA